MDAHLLMNQLENEGIECWLKDENTVTIDPLLTNAVGGIKLMVRKDDYPKAVELFQKIEHDRKQQIGCPKCKGHNIELVSTPRKASNWITAIITWVIGSFALTTDKVYHCFDCGYEFPSTSESEAEA